MNDFSLKFVSANGVKNYATRLSTSTIILALIFYNIDTSERHILIGTDSRQMESIQKEPKKPKDKKKKKKEKVVDGVQKIEELYYDIHVAAAGNVMLIHHIKEQLKKDVKTWRNQERTVESFASTYRSFTKGNGS